MCGSSPGAAVRLRGVRGSDTEVVGTPGLDGFFDLPGSEVLVCGAGGEGGEFIVGGEAEGDELGLREGVDEGVLGGGEECCEAEALFQPDEAVLRFKRGSAGDTGEDKEGEGHDDPPEEEGGVAGPLVNGGVDGGDEIKEEKGYEDKVKRGMVAGVAFEALRVGHAKVLSVTGWERRVTGGSGEVRGRLAGFPPSWRHSLARGCAPLATSLFVLAGVVGVRGEGGFDLGDAGSMDADGFVESFPGDAELLAPVVDIACDLRVDLVGTAGAVFDIL